MLQNHNTPNWLPPLLILLGGVALFYNYGLATLISDEGIRGMVALEMLYSGDYLTPTIGGDLYYKKPPLFNWIIVLSFKIFGNYNEWALRAPTIFFLIAYTFTIYHWVKKELGKSTALLAAFMFLTAGRIFFYESLLALIDITFSWIIFLLFISIYHFGKRQKWKFLYFSVYLLGLIGYFLKGLPAPVFIGSSLIAYFIYHKRFKILFHWAHFVGLAFFFSTTTLYYFAYIEKNGVSIQEVFLTIFNESARRTASGKGVLELITHLLTFPFVIIVHLMPWGTLILLWFRKGFIKSVRSHAFLSYCTLIFFSNIWVYWISPEFYPRYILMLFPFPIIFFAHFYLNTESKIKTIIEKLFVGLLALGLFIPFIPLILPLVENNTSTFVHSSILLLFFIGLNLAYWKKKIPVLPAFVICMILLRITFDAFVLPHRHNKEIPALRRSYVEELVKKHPDIAFHSYYPGKVSTDYYGRRNMTYESMFYITALSKRPYKITSEVKKGEYYLVLDSHFHPQLFETIDTIRINHPDRPGYSEFYLLAKGL